LIEPERHKNVQLTERSQEIAQEGYEERTVKHSPDHAETTCLLINQDPRLDEQRKPLAV